jgi:hypothetical protein
MLAKVSFNEMLEVSHGLKLLQVRSADRNRKLILKIHHNLHHCERIDAQVPDQMELPGGIPELLVQVTPRASFDYADDDLLQVSRVSSFPKPAGGLVCGGRASNRRFMPIRMQFFGGWVHWASVSAAQDDNPHLETRYCALTIRAISCRSRSALNPLRMATKRHEKLRGENWTTMQ